MRIGSKSQIYKFKIKIVVNLKYLFFLSFPLSFSSELSLFKSENFELILDVITLSEIKVYAII